MQNRTVEIGVGLFLLAGILALLLLALRVSGLSASPTADTYKLYAYFDNIAGLTVRSKVTMAGVTIGKVTAIDLDRDSFTGRVTMQLDKKVDNLPTDSTASILTAGLLGEKYIGVSVGGGNSPAQGWFDHPRHTVVAGARRPDREIFAQYGQ